MAQRLKRWESPRNNGRNVKGRGGSARQRQLRKRMQHLRHMLKLKDSTLDSHQSNSPRKKEPLRSFFFLRVEPVVIASVLVNTSLANTFLVKTFLVNTSLANTFHAQA